jgi:hypothetical protein
MKLQWYCTVVMEMDLLHKRILHVWNIMYLINLLLHLNFNITSRNPFSY